MRSSSLARRSRSMARCLAVVISQAPGLVGDARTAATARARRPARPAPAPRRGRRRAPCARGPAMSFAYSMRKTASMARWVSVAVTAADHTISGGRGQGDGVACRMSSLALCVGQLCSWPAGHDGGRLRPFQWRLKDRKIAGIACERVKCKLTIANGSKLAAQQLGRRAVLRRWPVEVDDAHACAGVSGLARGCRETRKARRSRDTCGRGSPHPERLRATAGRAGHPRRS